MAAARYSQARGGACIRSSYPWIDSWAYPWTYAWAAFIVPGLLLGWFFSCTLHLAAGAVMPERTAPATVYRQNAITLNREGLALMQEGRAVEAIQRFRLGLQFNPNSTLSATLYNNLGLAYERYGLTQQAIASFQYAQQLHPGFMPSFENLILAWANAGLLPQAIEDLQQQLAYNPQDANAWLLLGLAQWQSDAPEAAYEAWRQYLQLNPRSPISSELCFKLPNCQGY